MTKEELKKEAEEYAEQCYGWTNNDLALDVAKATYITSAEPREKRIEALTEQLSRSFEKINELEKDCENYENEIIRLKNLEKENNKWI